MDNKSGTSERIMRAATGLFVEQGIKKTSLEEIAHRAGVTRVTVYRHFGDKESLVRDMFSEAAEVFEDIRDSLSGGALQDLFSVFNGLRAGLSKYGDVSFVGRFDELRRVYPGIYEEYRAKRKAAFDGVFDVVLKTVKKRGLLRKGINETVLRVVFFDAIVNIIENPDMAGYNMSREEIFGTIRTVLLFGIIDPQAAEQKGGGKSKSR
jgi:AcrR family transcriptional regulator